MMENLAHCFLEIVQTTFEDRSYEGDLRRPSKISSSMDSRIAHAAKQSFSQLNNDPFGVSCKCECAENVQTFFMN